MTRDNVKAFSDTHLGGPGICDVMEDGLTITLPTWDHWVPDFETGQLGSVRIKDRTGSNPDCTIVAAGGGLIDGKPSVILTQAHGSLTFDPSDGGNNWTLA